MKVEILSENKIKITLSFEELRQRNVTLNDLEKDSTKAKKLFLDLIAESDLEPSFIFEHAQLFVEASTDNNDLFTVTITKIDDFPDLTKYNILDEDFSKKNKSFQNKHKRMPITTNIFLFDSLDSILQMCTVLNKRGDKHFIGKNTLYYFENNYYLIFSRYSIKNTKFLKTYSILTEFSLELIDSSLLEMAFKEKAKLIIKDKAIQKLLLV